MVCFFSEGKIANLFSLYEVMHSFSRNFPFIPSLSSAPLSALTITMVLSDDHDVDSCLLFFCY
jgi:hypothetical protein